MQYCRCLLWILSQNIVELNSTILIMDEHLKLTKTEAKSIIIESQLLNNNLSSLDNINKLGYVQIDTLFVAERAHHHVFHTRNSSYMKADLDDMMSKKQVFEYWSHAASYLPISDYRFSLIRKRLYAKGQSHWFKQNKKMNRYVLDRIKAEGPLQSKNFKETRDIPSAWYDRKPAKIALEQLFIEGTLMIAERKNFQKVYDLTERVLPPSIDSSIPSAEEYCEYLIKSTLKAQGLSTINEIGYLRKGIKPVLGKVINKLVESNDIVSVQIEGVDQKYFALCNFDHSKSPQTIHILSPFDNLVIQRKRLITLFDFDYQIECYLPEAKRKFGYYCLPVLYGNQFVARFDPKADRKTGVFTIKKLWFETAFIADKDFYQNFSKKLKQFASFCGCEKILIEKCVPTHHKKELLRMIKTL